jgi:hypothetical protein
MNNEPRFTAYNQATEPSRLDRLKMVWGYAVALADQCGNAAFTSAVAELHDHKGILGIVWKRSPSAGEKEFFSRAWKSSVGDRTDIVEHELESSSGRSTL